MTRSSANAFSSSQNSPADLSAQILKSLLVSAAPSSRPRAGDDVFDLEVSNPFADRDLSTELKQQVADFQPIEMDRFLYTNRRRANELKVAIDRGTCGHNDLSIVCAESPSSIVVSILQNGFEIYTKDVAEPDCETGHDFLIKAESTFKKLGMEAAKPYYEAAVKNADLDADILTIISEIVFLGRVVRLGRYQNRHGHEHRLSQDQFISTCTRIVALLDRLKFPVECRYAFSHALLVASARNEAEHHLRQGKVFADAIPVELIRQIVATIAKRSNEFEPGQRDYLFELAVKLESTAQVPKNFRLGLSEYFLCGAVSADPAAPAEDFVVNIDEAKSLIEEAVYNTDVTIINKETGRVFYLKSLSELLEESSAA